MLKAHNENVSSGRAENHVINFIPHLLYSYMFCDLVNSQNHKYEMNVFIAENFTLQYDMTLKAFVRKTKRFSKGALFPVIHLQMILKSLPPESHKGVFSR